MIAALDRCYGWVHVQAWVTAPGVFKVLVKVATESIQGVSFGLDRASLRRAIYPMIIVRPSIVSITSRWWVRSIITAC